jgi:hypothetical protein
LGLATDRTAKKQKTRAKSKTIPETKKRKVRFFTRYSANELMPLTFSAIAAWILFWSFKMLSISWPNHRPDIYFFDQSRPISSVFS